MAEYIEKNEFFDAIREEFYDRIPTGSEVISRLLKFPAADVRENVKGKWRGCGGLTEPARACTECGFADFARLTERYSYCPNCGAKMGGTEDGK